MVFQRISLLLARQRGRAAMSERCRRNGSGVGFSMDFNGSEQRGSVVPAQCALSRGAVWQCRKGAGASAVMSEKCRRNRFGDGF